MSKSFPQKESDMYPVIEKYFKKTLKCDKVFKDDGDGMFTRLRKNLRIAEVDITALKEPEENNCRIHLVEAKSFARRQSFQECFDQITAIRNSGHYLWVAFPEQEWDSLKENEKKDNEGKLTENGFGLLLVNEDECYPEIKAPLNKHIMEENKNEVLEQLGFSSDVFLPPVETLGSEECKKASKILLLMEMVEEIVKKITKRKKVDTWEGDKDAFEHYFYNTSIYFSDGFGIEFDPFARYLRDGMPVVWIWVYFRDNPTPKELEILLNKTGIFGTHILLDNNNWKWQTIPIFNCKDASIYWIKKGFSQVWFGQRIEVNGRHREALKREIEESLKKAKLWLKQI